MQVDGSCEDGILLHEIWREKAKIQMQECGRTFVLNPIKPRNYPEGFKEIVIRAVVK